MSDRPLILCVDDERNVIDSMMLNLRKYYDVHTALTAQEGLELLLETPGFAVIVSDMRMPDMDGATFLSMARKLAPDAVRMLLTGYADVESAMRAVNEGQVFRFLTKPCAPPDLLATISAGVDQHRLITAERVLLQNTLLGSVRALVDLLALINPLGLGRAVRIRDRARRVMSLLDMQRHWHVEFAALLSQLGAALLPEDTVRQIHDGEKLSEPDRQRLVENMGTINEILANIPRLEPVTELLNELRSLTVDGGTTDAAVSQEARLVHHVIELEGLEAQGHSLRQAVLQLADRARTGDENLFRALQALAEGPGATECIHVDAGDLTDGMVLAQDVLTADGVLLLPKGFEVSHSAREHIANYADRLPESRIKVLVEARPSAAHPSSSRS